MKKNLFFAAYCLSAIGDVLLYIALPVGLGLQSGDIRKSVVLFIVPGISILLAVFLKNKISQRLKLARKDYGKLLLLIGLLELCLALVSRNTSSELTAYLCIIGFVAVYAFAKEGIPRLFYLVKVYLFFCEKPDYAKVVGVCQGITIAASIIGSLLSAWIIAIGHWKAVLFIDSVTFFLYGGVIFLLGKDIQQEDEALLTEGKRSPIKITQNDIQCLEFTKISVPAVIAVTSLFWPYLPLLAEKYSVTTVASSIVMMAFLRLPGLFLGLNYSKFTQFFNPQWVVFWFPCLYLLLCFLFVFVPSLYTFVLLLFFHGLFEGVYYPSDYLFRNKLGDVELVDFNALLLKRIAITQILFSLLAICIYSRPDFGKLLSIAEFGVLVTALFFLVRIKKNVSQI